MRRGDLYRVQKPKGDVKESRVLVVVSRDALLRTAFSTVIYAPIMCDNLTSLRRSDLTDYVGSLPPAKVADLNRALRSALDLD